jgi:ACS family hexuronate transporter-like MFS transporter
MVVWIAVQWNWRMAFVVTGLLGFVWLLFWLWLYRLPDRHPHITPEELAHIQSGQRSVNASDLSHDDAKPSRWRDLFKDRNALSLVFARMFADPVWWFYVFWLPVQRQAFFPSASITIPSHP